MSPSFRHIPMASTSTLERGPLCLRLFNSTTHHVLLNIKLGPNSAGFPLMSNSLVAATFHVVRGTIRFNTCRQNSVTAPIEQVDVTQGSTVSAPPGTFFGFENPFDIEAEIQCIYSPGGWVQHLGEWATFDGDWMDDEAKDIMRRFGTVFLGDEPGGDCIYTHGEEDEELEFNPNLRCMA